jgi:hypothetical protein
VIDADYYFIDVETGEDAAFGRDYEPIAYEVVGVALFGGYCGNRVAFYVREKVDDT